MTLTSRGAVTCSFPNVALHPTISSSFYPLPICFYWEKFFQGGCQQKQHCVTPPPHPQHIWKSIGIDFRLHLPWLWTASENKQAFSWNHLNISDNYRKLTIGRWDCFAIGCRRRGSNGALQRWGKLSHNWLHPPMEKHRKICKCCSGYSPTVRH